MKRVLVVEDDPDIAGIYRLLLHPRFAVAVAPDLASARAYLKSAAPPDLILLDLMLPDGDGLELCREVKARDPALPVLVVTASRGAGRAAVASGADGFLAKPAELEAIEAAVDRLAA